MWIKYDFFDKLNYTFDFLNSDNHSATTIVICKCSVGKMFQVFGNWEIYRCTFLYIFAFGRVLIHWYFGILRRGKVLCCAMIDGESLWGGPICCRSVRREVVAYLLCQDHDLRMGWGPEGYCYYVLPVLLWVFLWWMNCITAFFTGLL